MYSSWTGGRLQQILSAEWMTHDLVPGCGCCQLPVAMERKMKPIHYLTSISLCPEMIFVHTTPPWPPFRLACYQLVMVMWPLGLANLRRVSSDPEERIRNWICATVSSFPKASSSYTNLYLHSFQAEVGPAADPKMFCFLKSNFPD